MKQKYILSGLLLLLSFSCGKGPDTTFQILLDSEPIAHEELSDQLLNPFSVTEPSTLSQVNCVGAFLGYEGLSNRGNCYTSFGATLGVSQYGGLVPYNPGAPASIRVPNVKIGAGFRTYIVGLLSGAGCAAMTPSFDPKALGYSKLYLLGEASSVIQDSGGALNITTALNTNNYMNKCDSSIFDYRDLSDGLIGFWDFENLSGGVFADKAGSGLTITAVNGLTTTSGSIGGGTSAALFDGSNDYGSETSETLGTIDPGEAHTYSLWLSPSTLSNQDIFGRYLGGGSYDGQFMLQASSSGVWSLLLSYNGVVATTVLSSSCNLAASAWQHYVFIISAGGSFTAYKDGVQCDSFLHSATHFSNSSGVPFKLGTSGYYGVYTGKMDSFGVWNRALTASEVSTLYNSGSGKDYPF